MKFDEVLAGFKTLNAPDRQRLIDAAKQFNKTTNYFNLRAGAKVQFKVGKTGAYINGVFVRMKTKYAEVEAYQDKYGRQVEHKVRWSVPMESLMPLTPSQAKVNGV
jgi:hypothetical protein